MEARPPREVALPAQGFARLRHALRDEVGPLAAVHGLHAAGYGVGEAFFALFTRTLEADPGQVPEEELWGRLSRFFQQKGWGTLQHRAAHPGVGLLETFDWAEVERETETQPACAFTAGLLSSFLTGLAGGPVAVLEVACASRGDDGCVFAFGSETAIHELYGHLLEGAALDDALALL